MSESAPEALHYRDPNYRSVMDRRIEHVMTLAPFRCREPLSLCHLTSPLNMTDVEARKVAREMVARGLLVEMNNRQWCAPLASKSLISKRWV